MKRYVNVLVITVLTLFVIAPVASAAITSSQITTPSTTTFMLKSSSGTEANYPESITIAGTTNSTAPGTDVVDIVCVRGGGTTSTLATSVGLASDGTFATSLAATVFPSARTCRLRAVPTGTNSAAFWRFDGPIIAISDYIRRVISSGPNTGQLESYGVNLVTQRGDFNLDTLGDSAINDAEPLTSSLNPIFNSVVDQAFALTRSSPLAAVGTTSSIQIDGVDAYATEAAWIRAGANWNAPGLPSVTLVVSVDPTRGPTIIETAALAACTDETQASCPAFTPLPVQIVRTYTPSPDGQRLLVRDAIASTDGSSHEVRLDYSIDSDTVDFLYAVAGSGAFQRYTMTTGPLDLGAAPQTLIGRTQDASILLGTTWRTTPDLTLFTNSSEGDSYVGRFTRTVTGTPTTLDMTFNVGLTMDALRDTSLDQEDVWSAPAVTIDAPAEGATSAGSTAAITGTTTGRTLLGIMRTPTVTVNGVAALVEDDGRWSVEVPLTRGANTITATATNTAGATATAIRTINAGAKARRLTAVVNAKARAQARKGTRAIVVRGRLGLPAGIRAADGCSGMVRVTVRVGKRHVATRWAALRPTCQYAIRTPLPRRGVATISAHFTGNPYVLARSARTLTVATSR